ncbi:MAG: M23 family metallopeptidase [Spirochaetales bacterium]|nr:M23 family metallopeptidase [Spirochaetales bacterium]
MSGKTLIRRLILLAAAVALLTTCVFPTQPEEETDTVTVEKSGETEVDLSGESRGELVRGDNLVDMVLREGIQADLANRLVLAVAPHVDMVHLQPGQQGYFTYDSRGDLVLFQFEEGDGRVVEATLSEGQIQVSSRSLILSTRTRMVTGQVNSSLYNAAIDCGMPLNVFMDMIQLFSFDVDFQRDIRQGDYFDAAYEEIYNERGELVDYGEVVMARLYTRGGIEEHLCYRYVKLDGTRDWYDSEGGTVRKELLKTPVNGAYISSGYGTRVSPITGFTHKHKGIDFAAPTGTPINASGKGTITQIGWNDSYGWYIRIRHTNGYETLYGHMSAYASGMRRGSYVDQGQVIGYVGSTGMSTGPHCHYEVIYYGTKINPATMKFPPGETLSGDDLELFQLTRKSLISSFL